MLPLRKKLVLVAVCSMTVFMMICAIIRMGLGLKERLTDFSWFLLWNSVEMTLGTFSTFLKICQCAKDWNHLLLRAPPPTHYDLCIIPYFLVYSISIVVNFLLT